MGRLRNEHLGPLAAGDVNDGAAGDYQPSSDA